MEYDIYTNIISFTSKMITGLLCHVSCVLNEDCVVGKRALAIEKTNPCLLFSTHYDITKPETSSYWMPPTSFYPPQPIKL